MRQKLATTATAVLITGAAVAALTVGSDQVGATATYKAFYGYAAGSEVRAADATITSDLTGRSTTFSVDKDATDSRQTADVTIPNLLTATALRTSSVVKPVAGGRALIETSRLGHVSLLGGAITLDAVTTTSIAKSVNGKLSSSSDTSFAGIHVAGVNIPLNVPKNYTVGINGVATVTLNVAQVAGNSATTVSTGAAMAVSLLKGRGDSPVGTTVYLNPTYASAGSGSVPDSGHRVTGVAYATALTAKVGSAASITSQPTASVQAPFVGTEGKTLTQSVGGVNVPGVITGGVAKSTAVATNTRTGADSKTATSVAGLSLFGGVVKVSAVSATARATVQSGKPLVLQGTSSLGNLVIAGKSYPLTVKPNTTLKLLNIGTIVLNEQVKDLYTGMITVRAVHITLSTAAYGLKAGAEIVIASASASAA